MAKHVSSTPVALCSTPAWKLDKFIKENLLGDLTFLTELRTDVDSISAFLMERCFQGAVHPMRVSRVVMGGSFNPYTVLKGRSEVNLLVFFNNLTCFDDQFKLQGEVIEEIRKHLCQFQPEKRLREKLEVQSSEQSLSFKLSYPKFQQEVEFHVQTAYDALYEVRRKEHFKCEIYNKVYAQLIRECTILDKEGEFNICFMELQQDFLWKRPRELKNLICLVQHWYRLPEKKGFVSL
ncbi:inactive 2'-5' oligoadenylate synthetase 1C-like isoform X2 [Mus pahari]|uniref:inactive 2'-5' oligoadenylate synthetase 1C-like isoform X2 n=1 Tax=Mus pahari TaxID=10093 RepID=UPI000A30B324|nr:inactive 2'-5' oligoadenylate synthetase 1C-like isoform X2 [Mus pahari]